MEIRNLVTKNGGVVFNWSAPEGNGLNGHDIHSDDRAIEDQIRFCETVYAERIVAIWRPSKKNKVTDKK